MNLTKREHEIALLVAEGLRNAEIAERLGITLQTVKNHLHTIYNKRGMQRGRRTLLAVQITGEVTAR